MKKLASEALKNAMLETALDSIIMMDQQGKVVDFNPAAEKTFGYSRSDVIGRDLADLIVPPSLRERHRQGMARYIATGEGPLLGKRVELPALHADGSEFPVELTITHIVFDGPPLFTAYLRDITERKRSEQHRTIRLAATLALSEAATVDEGATGVLQAVCENLGWELGFFWKVNGARTALVCKSSWRKPDVPKSEFEVASFSRTFEKGEGLPGHVWSTGKPRWLIDVERDANFARAAYAAKFDLNSAFACPIEIGGRVSGVIEFFTRRIREPEADLLEMMMTVAGSLGQFIERKTAEHEVQQSEQELADFFENASVGLHLVGPDGTILRANRAELHMLGYSRAEYIGRFISDFHIDEDVIGEILHRLQNGEKLNDFPARLRCKDGSIKDVLIDSCALIHAGDVVYTRCFTRDITERKRAEEHFRFLAKASGALAAVVDYESTLQKIANLAVPYLADWSAVDLQDDDGNLRRLAVSHKDADKAALVLEFLQQYPPDPQSRVGGYAVLRSGKPQIINEIRDEMLAQVAQDERHLALIRSLGLKSYISVPLSISGKALGLLTFATAESGRKYTEADLAVAVDLARRAEVAIENNQLYEALHETDRRKDEFLATLAHELRNPLAPVLNALEVLKIPGVDSQIAERSREIMERQVKHLVRLLDDLLDISRTMRGKIELRKEKIELARIVASAVETVQPLVDIQRHRLNVRLSDESMLLDADPVRLVQVVGNLLSNAAKYTEPNGEIWLTGERKGDMVVLRVQDNGMGIGKDMLHRIFGLFEQAEHDSSKVQGGLGIGLTLVMNLVKLHNGTVEAHSEGLGHGSEFELQFPLAEQSVEQDHGSSTVGQADRASSPSGKRILVVDDNQDIADSLVILLKLQHHEVRVTYSGVEALEMIKTFIPDVVLLDIGMPGMDGYEVALRIRKTPGLENVVLAALTGWGQPEDRRRTAEAGFDHHLVKPWAFEDLEKLLA